MYRRKTYNRIRTRAMKIHAFKVQSFVILFLLVSVLLASYVTLIGVSVKNVVLRKEMETKVALLRADIAEMEQEYLTRVSDITLARADGMGLGSVASKSFAERTVLVGQAY